MASLRTKEGKAKHQEYRNNTPKEHGCPLCNKPSIDTFKYWKITDNSFPYDLIADKHHMLIPIRHVVEGDLSAEERNEMFEIKKGVVDAKYDYIIEATDKEKSIPDHFHLHLIIGKNS